MVLETVKPMTPACQMSPHPISSIQKAREKGAEDYWKTREGMPARNPYNNALKRNAWIMGYMSERSPLPVIQRPDWGGDEIYYRYLREMSI